MEEFWVYNHVYKIKIKNLSKIKVVSSGENILLLVFWDAKGIILIEYLQKSESITEIYYSKLISKLREILKEKRRGKRWRAVSPSKLLSNTSCIAKTPSKLPIGSAPTIFARLISQLQDLTKIKGVFTLPFSNKQELIFFP